MKMFWKRSMWSSMLPNTSTTTAVVPPPTPLWIQSYSIWQGSNQFPSEIILLENLLNMDDVKLNEYGPSMLIDPSNDNMTQQE